ncbi:NADPH oxidase 5 isoform X1 [Hylaeus anthracinus]|uniref:NADPH oxidase 5 isoform X1 n=2 Tax=Hylaeus anthracinus TaxID=313031 RepID=UPI0023B9813E|nr:NADPH oxidase 5 isoform X1 [Hylaeus anthracinus]
MESDVSQLEKKRVMKTRRATTLAECSQIVEVHCTARCNRDAFRRLFMDQTLLEKLFLLFDQYEEGLLKQDVWFEFVKSRLTNESQNDFIAEIDSVVYSVCGDDPVSLTNFQHVFSSKEVVDRLFRVIDEDNVGYVMSSQIMRFITNITDRRPRSGFDTSSLEWLEKLFKQTVGNEKEIRREEFNKIVTSKNPFFTDRAFQIFDKDNSGAISLQEFLDTMHQFAGKSPDDKISFLFKVYDIDGDGSIQLFELEHVMRACMEENGMEFSDEQIKDLTIALFEDADQDKRGSITYEALKNQLEKHEGLLENLTISIDRWLVPPKPKAKRKSLLGFFASLRPYQLTRPYMKNNYVYIAFISVFILINVTLFVARLYEYRRSNGYVMVARACGQCLNFNCSFILILMLRQCITFLRSHGFIYVLPLDQHIYLHKITGVLIGVFGIVHTLMHLLNFGTVVVYDPILNSNKYTIYEWLFTDRPGLFGLVKGWANPTGFILVLILAIMTICSMPFVRRGGCFEIFYWSHLLYIPFWILTILHGPNFWKWFIAPGAIYLAERIRRIAWSRSQLGKTYISSGLLLPSKVTHLVIKRPVHFDFRPGDYVFVNVPAIARYEWHPFTISSAPEQEDYIWLHIRAVGEWTNRLYSYFEKEQMKLHEGNAYPIAESTDIISPGKMSFLNKNQDLTVTSIMSSSSSETDNCGLDNPTFIPDNDNIVSSTQNINGVGDNNKVPKDRKLHSLLLGSKIRLEKSISVPDIQTRKKKKERLLALRDYMRSESERNFDEYQMRSARLKSLEKAYSSPQHKKLAENFRYLRTKPTLIAFKTPSLENWDCEAKTRRETVSRTSVNDRRSMSPSVVAIQITEEGDKTRSKLEETSKENRNDNGLDVLSRPPINYAVGKPLKIFLNGPYGAPSSHIFQAHHAVLIATGIGVTPFASILQSIMHRYWKARHTCPKCEFSWASEIPSTVMHLRKVDFFWINRDQRSFEWFVNLLSQLEMEQAELGDAMEHFLEMHMYITSALQKNDMKAVGLQLAMDLVHQTEKRDLITGLKTRTNAGRPNWDKVFKQIQDKKKGKVTVFYCGPPQLAKVLRLKCDQFGFNFKKESF